MFGHSHRGSMTGRRIAAVLEIPCVLTMAVCALRLLCAAARCHRPRSTTLALEWRKQRVRKLSRTDSPAFSRRQGSTKPRGSYCQQRRNGGQRRTEVEWAVSMPCWWLGCRAHRAALTARSYGDPSRMISSRRCHGARGTRSGFGCDAESAGPRAVPQLWMPVIQHRCVQTPRPGACQRYHTGLLLVRFLSWT